MAALNPDIAFHGIDLSDEMLERGHTAIQRHGLRNVTLSRGDMTSLDFEDHAVDGVVSTFAMHHLPSGDHLRRCFREVRRVLAPGGAIYLTDFCRLKRGDSVAFVSRETAAHQPAAFRRDLENSLRAAFKLAELQGLAAEELAGQVEVVSTFLVPLIAIVKTHDHRLPRTLIDKLRCRADTMPPRCRADLRALRWFFRLGGLRDDPFL